MPTSDETPRSPGVVDRGTSAGCGRCHTSGAERRVAEDDAMLRVLLAAGGECAGSRTAAGRRTADTAQADRGARPYRYSHELGRLAGHTLTDTDTVLREISDDLRDTIDADLSNIGRLRTRYEDQCTIDRDRGPGPNRVLERRAGRLTPGGLTCARADATLTTTETRVDMRTTGPNAVLKHAAWIALAALAAV